VFSEEKYSKGREKSLSLGGEEGYMCKREGGGGRLSFDSEKKTKRGIEEI